MTNTINNMKDAPGVIAKMGAQMLADKVQFCKTIDKADKSDFDGKNAYRAGDTITISKPARFVPSTGADITSSIQGIVEEKTSLTLDTRSVVPVQLDSAEVFTELGLASWTKRVLDPAISSIAQDVESRFLAKAIDASYHTAGTAGANTYDTDTLLEAGQKINESACPDLDNRFALLNPLANRKAVNARKGLFNSSDELSAQYKKGYMGTADGFDFLSNNLLGTHTNGTDVTGALVNDGAVAEGASSIAVDGLTNASTATKGSVFTIAGVFKVHPVTKVTLADLEEFVVTADATVNGSGEVTLAISPSLYAGSNGLQNVSALPADNAALTFVGDASTGYGQSLAYHKSAFRMVSVPLMLPSDAHLAAQETVDGMTVRVWLASDVLTDTMTARIDFLGGLAPVRPEWSTRFYN